MFLLLLEIAHKIRPEIHIVDHTMMTMMMMMPHL